MARSTRISAFILLLLSVPCLCAAGVSDFSSSGLFAKAAEEAAEETIFAINDWIASDPDLRTKVPLNVAVWAVVNDGKDIVRNCLMEQFSQSRSIKVRVSIRTVEFDKFKEHIPDKKKWEFLYDSETLVKLQNLKEARFMIDARVEDYRESGSKSEMDLVTKIIDYEKGSIETIRAHSSATALNTIDWAWRTGAVVVAAVCCVVFVFWANWQSIRFWYFWAVLAFLETGFFWFLVGRHL